MASAGRDAGVGPQLEADAAAAPERGAEGGPAATLHAWREQGAHRLDPVRFHFLEALTRRAGGCEGAARAVLDARLAVLLAEYGEALAKARAGEPEAATAPGARHAPPRQAAMPVPRRVVRADARAAPQRREPAPRRGPLGGLVEQLAGPAPGGAEGPAHAGLPSGPAPGPARDLRSLSYFRDTWSRLSAERRVAQSLADVPENAGPLNSRRLVHRALASLQELSPDYLHRFVAYVDALLWLEGVNGRGGASTGK